MFDKLYKCTCSRDYLRIEKDDDLVYFLKFTEKSTGLSFFSRIKLAFQYIFNPKKFDIHDGLIFSDETTRKIAKDLLTITTKKDDDIMFGDNNEF